MANYFSNQRMLAQHAQRRYQKSGKKTTEQLFDDIWAQTAEMMHLCIWTALQTGYGLTEDKVNEVAQWADRLSAQYINAQRNNGIDTAKKELKMLTDPLFISPFILPAAKALKKNRDWAELNEQRAAADMVARLYARAMHRVLSFDRKQIDRVLRLAGDIYREKAKEAGK